ncbi:MAG TPA: hypothetical protein VIT45_12175 [Allosphingosinicella sp.]
MKGVYPEALLYCVLWVALALFGLDRLGWKAGLALSVGLFLIVMPASAIVLSRTGNFTLERGVRWAILAAAAVGLFSLVDLG